LQNDKSTSAIDAYNLIKEAYDLTGFDETQEIDPLNKQRSVLANIRKKPEILPAKKRKSLEMLSEEMQCPTFIPHPTIPSQNQSIPPATPVNIPAAEPGVLTQTFTENIEQSNLPMQASGSSVSKVDFMGYMMKQQMMYNRDADAARKRQDENLQRFQKMMMDSFKN